MLAQSKRCDFFYIFLITKADHLKSHPTHAQGLTTADPFSPTAQLDIKFTCESEKKIPFVLSRAKQKKNFARLCFVGIFFLHRDFIEWEKVMKLM